VYVCGQTGEGRFHSLQQRKLVTEAAVSFSPPEKTVIAHIGAQSLEEGIELARHAARTGVAAISSLPPLGAVNFEQIRAYYHALVQECDLPLFIYYFPELCPAIGRRELEQLSEIPGVAGLKFTHFNLYELALLKNTGLVVLNGRDEVLIAGMLMGADGGIGSFYNLVPDLFVKAYQLCRHEKWEEARVVQRTINELIRITLDYPIFPAIKCLLQWSGTDCGTCLPALGALTESQQSELRARLQGPLAVALHLADLEIA
jgi:N-acetylneuraminate lyase